MESLAGDDPAEIAGYRLGARLGAGGMGRVYLAFTAGGRRRRRADARDASLNSRRPVPG
jgi:hypothetical protein